MLRTASITEFSYSAGGIFFGVEYTTACDRLDNINRKRENEVTRTMDSIDNLNAIAENEQYKERAEQ